METVSDSTILRSRMLLPLDRSSEAGGGVISSRSRKLGTSASQAACVGDGGSSELEGARKAGLGRVLFMRGFVSHNGLRNAAEFETFRRIADVSVDSLQELSPVLEISESNLNG